MLASLPYAGSNRIRFRGFISAGAACAPSDSRTLASTLTLDQQDNCPQASWPISRYAPRHAISQCF